MTALERFADLHKRERIHFPHAAPTFEETCDIALCASLQQVLDQYRADRLAGLQRACGAGKLIDFRDELIGRIRRGRQTKGRQNG